MDMHAHAATCVKIVFGFLGGAVSGGWVGNRRGASPAARHAHSMHMQWRSGAVAQQRLAGPPLWAHSKHGHRVLDDGPLLVVDDALGDRVHVLYLWTKGGGHARATDRALKL